MKTLFKPVDSAILIYFRFFAGILLSCELLSRLNLKDITTASVHSILLLVTVGAGFMLALGIRQKTFAVVLFLGYTLLFLTEGRLYLYWLISFWLIWMPVPQRNRLESPRWYYCALLFHVLLLYFHTGPATFYWFSIMLISLLFGASWPRKFTWFDHFYPDPLKQVTYTRWIIPGLGLYCLLQLLFPFRQNFYPKTMSEERRAATPESAHEFAQYLEEVSGNARPVLMQKESLARRLTFFQDGN